MLDNDSRQHVVKTSEQWDERAIEFWVVPRGCLCVELTPDKKTKIKIGEGNKFYSQLPYITGDGDFSEYYTKEEMDRILDNLNRMAIMSTEEYDSKNDLPLDGNKLGDVRFVKSASPSLKIDPDLYVWNGTKWIYIGYDFSDIDLSKYVTKEEFNVVKDKVDEMYPKMHTHENKDVLDATEKPFKTADKEKLDSLHNYDDTEIRQLIHDTGHTHPNKPILDTITTQSILSPEDREKFDSLHNYDDTQVVVRIETLEDVAHTHSNKNILDQTTAPFKVADKEKLDSLEVYNVFTGTDGIYPGGKGLVPGPAVTDSGKFLSSSGEWLEVNTAPFTGATATTDGTSGAVPIPLAGQQLRFLRGDGIWAKVKTGDKYRAGDGITILSGEVISDTFPFQILPQAEQVTQYIIYGAPGGVGDAVTGGYSVQINASAEGHADRSVTAIIPDKMYEGDYIDYQKQVYSTYRTNVTSRVSADPNYSRKWGIYSDGRIASKDPGAYGDYPCVTALFELEPGASYEITKYNDHDHSRFEDAMHINLYDENQNVTRTIAQSWSGSTTFTPAATDKYMRFAYREDIWSWTSYERQKVWQLKDIERPCGLPELFLYPGVVNTINATTTVKPSLMYIEVEPPDDPESEDPTSEFTGIIYNDGVLDITQEDPNALNELTVHFRESDKVITVPTGGSTYTAGDGIDIDANDEISAKLGSGLQFDANGAIEVIGGGTGGNYGEGDAIKFEYEPIVPGDAVTHVKWSLLQTRGREAGTSDDCIQVREFEMRNIDNELISFKSNVTGVFVPSSTTPIYGSSETPDRLVDGTSGKMCCANFTSSITEFIFTMEPTTPVPMNRIKDYRYITAEDVPNRDPITWVLYVSTDGTNYIEVDRRIDQTITQSRSTATSYYTPSFPSTLSTTINVQYGDGLEVDNDNDLTVKLGTGLQFDTNGAIEAPGSRIYVDGDGIMITDNTSFELSEDTVTNTEYFFDTQVTSSVLGRIYTKYNTEPALGAVVYYESSYTQPFFVGLTADSVKYGTDWDSQIWPNPDHPTFEYKGVTWYYSGNAYGMRGEGTDASGHMQKLPGNYSVSTEADLQNIAKAIIDAADIITDPTKIISAKLGSGLQFDTNGAIEVIGGGGQSYVEGDAIEFGHPGMTDLGFDFDKFVSKFTEPNNGIVSVDSANKAFTLTATGSDAYTNPWTGGDLYTIPVVGGRKYRLTWDSNAPTVGGNVYAFENANTSHMHGVNQADQNYLEFTADTTSNVNFRFGVSNSGNSITFSNIKFYEVDNADPDTNIINVKYGSGLSLDNSNRLQANAMTGADGTNAGTAGIVPAPTATDNTKFLKGDGTWDSPPSYTLPIASDQTLGGIKVGNGLSIDQNGVLGVSQEQATYTAGPGIDIQQGTYETYRVVDYFQSDGSQTVDTGYCKTVANGSMNFEIKWRLVSTPSAAAYVLSTHDVGASVTTGSVYIGVNKGSSMSEYKPVGGIITSSSGASSFQFDSSGIPTSTRSDLAGFDDDGDITFNLNNTMYSTDTGATWRNVFLYDSTPAVIYFCKVFDDDVLVCDLVPCIRDEDDVQGFYDRVREIFIENTGTAFTAGQETGEVISRFVHESGADPYEISNTGVIEASYSKQNLELTLRNRNETIVVPVSDTQYVAGDNITVTGQQESFTLLQYIRGKGNQTINTHRRITSQEGKFEYKFQIKDSLSTAQTGRNQAVICGEYLHEASPFIGAAKSSSNVVGTIAGIVKSGGSLSWYWITQNRTTDLTEGSMAYHSDGTVTKNGSALSPSDWPVINDDEIYIFGNRDFKANCDLYYVKIYDNNVLIFDGIPVRRNSDGEIGLFDRVNNEFFMNDLGGGTFGFVAGPDVSGADPILGDYIGTTKTISATVGVTSVTQDSQNLNTLHVTTNGTTTDITIPQNTYTLPTASASTLGGIKVGDNLTIDANGVLSADGGTEYIEGQGIEIDSSSIYMQVEYLKSTGTQYIITDAVLDYTMKCEIDVKLGSTVRDYGSGLHRNIFGYDSNTLGSYNLFIDDDYDHGDLDWISYYVGFQWASGQSWTNRTKNTNVVNRSTAIVQRGTCSWNTDTCTTGDRSIDRPTPTLPMPIFAVLKGSPTSQSYDIFQRRDMYLYEFKIYDSNNQVIHDFIAVRRTTDNTLGLYDKTTETFYENAGTGTFEAGVDVGRLDDGSAKTISAKLGMGLSFDNNDAIQAPTMTGATSQSAGDAGIVPMPLAGDDDAFLRGDGTWANPPSYTLPVATTSTLGGVKVGAGLSMNANDELGVTSPYVTSVTNQGSLPGVITVAKSDGTSSDVDVLDNLRLILNCNFDSSQNQTQLGEPVNAPVAGNTEGSPILGDLTVLEV